MLLLPTYPIVLQPLLAELLGLREALLLQQIHYMAETYGNGRYQGSYADLARLVPKTAEPTAKRMANTLVELDLLIKEDTRPLTWKINKGEMAQVGEILLTGTEGDLFDLFDRLEVDQNDLQQLIEMIQRNRLFYTRVRKEDQEEDQEEDKEEKSGTGDNILDGGFVCSSCGKSNTPAVVEDSKERCVYCFILDAWDYYCKQYGAKKIQPEKGNSKLRSQAIARVKEVGTQNVATAIMRGLRIKALTTAGWFQLSYLLRNRENIEKTLDPNYWSWLDEKGESTDSGGNKYHER